MMYLLLILLLTGLGVIFYFLFDKEILSPTIISICMFILCTVFAYIGTSTWNDVQISFKLIFIILLGITAFGMGELSIRYINKKKKFRKKQRGEKKENSIIDVKVWKLIVIIFFILVTIAAMYMEISRISNSIGNYDTILQKVAAYRKVSPLFNKNAAEEGTKINIIVSQMKKFCDVICIGMLFIIINNFICKKSLKDFAKEDTKYLIPIFLSCVLSFLSSGRAQFLKYMVAALMIYLILLVKYNINDKKTIALKTIKTSIILLAIIIPIFYLVLPLTGRNTNKKFVNYVTFYFGCSIPSFQKYLDNPPKKSNRFGDETLYGVQMLLNKLNISDYINPIGREWTKYKEKDEKITYKSNVYTSFRRYYNDFGIIGVVICSLVFGIVFYILYNFAKNKKSPIYIIFYALYSYMIIDQIRDELFFTRFININTIINIILVIGFTYFINNLEIKNTKIKILKIFKKCERTDSENTK